jgi:hypothetical protein
MRACTCARWSSWRGAYSTREKKPGPGPCIHTIRKSALSQAFLADVLSLQALPAFPHLIGYLLTLLKGLEPLASYARVVHEDILAAIIWLDKAVALLGRKPLYCSLLSH